MKNITNQLLEHFESEITEEIRSYARDDVLTHSRYLFVSKGKDPETYCTHCRYWYYEEGTIKTGTQGICPNCKSTCIYKYAWRSRNTAFDAAYFLYFKKSIKNPQVVTATWYYASHDLRGNFVGTSIELTAVANLVFDCENNTGQMLERWSWNRDWTINDSITTPSVLRNSGITRKVAKQSIEVAAAGTKLAYSNWDKYALEDIGKYFALVLKYPSIETLSKAGETGVVKSKLYGNRTYSAVNWRATKLHNIFKVSKQDFTQLVDLKADLLDYWLWQQARKEKSKMSMKDLIMQASQYTLDIRMDIFKYLRKYSTIHRIFNYAEKQFIQNKKHYITRGQVLTTWRDYIEDCIKLKMDLTDEQILYPRNVEKAHQETMKRVKHYEDELMREKIMKRKEQLQKYEFQYGGFFIQIPKTAKEIIDEGSKLSHCVGSYAIRHMEGKITILFLRDVLEPDKPFYTIEMNSKEVIVQVRGHKNQPTTEEVQKFIDIFKVKKLKQQKARKSA
ncbi:PcfJ domain-containing protein [Solibacillus sp. FSL K6-1523]|uniref:PcfJ domain-containing protein n=1 Tax=Solibacillus sp. FSL K6-1523 TaxID=2921471 RepID=UPI0030F59E2D